MNLYANLTDIKRSLGITGTSFDAALVVLAESICRAIDDQCGRAFYPVTATRVFDGDGSAKLWLKDDLLTVTTLKTDDDGDGTYENTLAVTDYWLWPDNKSPKRRIDINPEGDYASFPAGRRRVQIAGIWGYSNDTETVGTLGEDVDGTETVITMAANHTVVIGDTLYWSTEQAYVSGVSTNDLTVTRAVNGTTAATPSNGAAVTRQAYPSTIIQAVKMQIGRFWNEEKTGYAGSAANADVGGFTFSTLYPAIRDMLSPYIAPVVG